MGRTSAHEGEELLFEDVKKKVEDLKVDPGGDGESQEEAGQRLVDEIESLCMNCQENVSADRGITCASMANKCHFTNKGHHSFAANAHSLLPRDHPHVLLLPTLQLPKR
jgi:hypothetical protein